MVRTAKKHYRVTRRARDDLLNIARYTESLWGKKQRDIYLKQLEKRFAWLAENPLRGKHRTDIQQGYYSFVQGQNVIDIIGVLHQQMDVVGYFNAPL
ncbi:type II toxin-antitoxin system RelE/ParE family toxin [Rheinheimera pleomorphica]|uniref:type II toxin-antitoxin system RelE/ParE family toxin n=1 Tax=Rheinheimera pleomorphica TaxID=2703963 RepID=UPI0014246BB8|nr:type II toxin-antitoxin system RelE/ParE family toxin [Rheinheimera pleomorphica]